uniref:Uncharacterized protein n=1 Tax=Rhizophora mucronata TaxID=61149 RepID=A0A2P2Q1S0_RHIMU
MALGNLREATGHQP